MMHAFMGLAVIVRCRSRFWLVSFLFWVNVFAHLSWNLVSLDSMAYLLGFDVSSPWIRNSFSFYSISRFFWLDVHRLFRADAPSIMNLWFLSPVLMSHLFRADVLIARMKHFRHLFVALAVRLCCPFWLALFSVWRLLDWRYKTWKSYNALCFNC